MPPDPREDRIVQSMEADIQQMATRLAPLQEGRERPRVTAGGLAPAAGPIGAGAVGKRLEELLKRSGELAKQAEVLATALNGPTNYPGDKANQTKAGDYLFGRQMAALDEIDAVLDSLSRSLERAQRALG